MAEQECKIGDINNTDIAVIRRYVWLRDITIKTYNEEKINISNADIDWCFA